MEESFKCLSRPGYGQLRSLGGIWRSNDGTFVETGEPASFSGVELSLAAASRRDDTPESGDELEELRARHSSSVNVDGVACADVDNDGDVDLYASNYDDNQFFRNNGDGTFTDVTAFTGTGEHRWSTSAAFFDYDVDGFMDLFVVNYVDFTCEQNKPCYSGTSAQDYCGPLSYQPYPNRLFRNNGAPESNPGPTPTFEDVSGSSGINREYRGLLGVVAADFNGDGLVNSADLMMAWRIMLGLTPALPTELAPADLYPAASPDGVIDIRDILLLEQLILSQP